MSGSDLVPGFCGLAAGVFLLVSLHLRRKQRLISDLPTAKAQGVFIGLVELCGTAESATPFTGFLSGAPCVLYEYQVLEHWSRQVTETYTDKDGKSRTRTRTETGATPVASGGQSGPFYLQDDTGVVLIRPERATLQPGVLFERMVTPLDALYYAKGPAGSVPDSQHRRTFVERGLPLHGPLYIVGQARERADVVAPEIAHDPAAAMFLISTRSEKSIQRGLAAGSWICWSLGAIAAAAAAAFTVHQYAVPSAAPWVIAAAAYLGLWGVAWTWMVFNSLVSLRNRVRQAWSLIDVQLKRRHDLIPSLVSAVAGLSSHEQTVQQAVTALRTQAQATPPGVAGPDVDGVAGRLRAVVEAYPNLVAQPAFMELHRQLVETEQRIALARTYYNDIATHFATRLERIPECWAGRLGGMRPEPRLEAAGFERAAVTVSTAVAGVN